MPIIPVALMLALSAYDPASISCVAEVVYNEARGESIVGQQAIAWVVLNRMESGLYPDDACDVVNQPNQFAVGGKPDELDAWATAIGVANVVLIAHQTLDDPTNGATSFHNTSISNPWDNLEKTTRIGSHVFYRVDS